MSVYQRPAYLFIAMVFCACTAVASAVACANWLHGSVIWRAIIAGVISLMMTGATAMFYRRLRNPPSLLTLTPLGFTNEYGQDFTWAQVTKIYKFTGVLFIKDGSKSGWVVRIDPTEVGSKKLSQAVAYIKANAPAALTTKL